MNLRDALARLAPLFKTLARTLYKYRRLNKNYTPPEIFEPVLGIGGTINCVEIAVVVRFSDKKRFLLKLRDGEDELSFRGKYHIPGATGRLNTGPDEMLQSVWREIFGKNSPVDLRRLQFAGTFIYNALPRLATYWSSLYILEINYSEVDMGFEGDWLLFENPRDPRIIQCHHLLLEHLLTWEKPGMFDCRHAIDENWLTLSDTSE